MGIDQEVGTLQKGKFADIISVKGKPDQNIYDLEKINFVMVGGKNYTGLSFRSDAWLKQRARSNVGEVRFPEVPFSRTGEPCLIELANSTEAM